MNEARVDEARLFGETLRRQRERHGITVGVIAERTKVAASLLAGLERGDLSRWPTGIFRRAFVRAYADAVGLDPETTVAEFLRIFPEEGAPRRSLTFGSGGLRLTLAEPDRPWLQSRRIAGVLTDGAVVAGAAAVAWIGQATPGVAPAAVAVVGLWHAFGALAWGTTPGLRIWTRPVLAARRPASPFTRPVETAVAVEEPTVPLVAAVTEPERQVLTVPEPHVHEPARAAVLSIASAPRHRSRRDRRHHPRAERERDVRPSSHR